MEKLTVVQLVEFPTVYKAWKADYYARKKSPQARTLRQTTVHAAMSYPRNINCMLSFR